MATRRKYLSGLGGNKQSITIDMEEVYRMIDNGMKVKDVAAHLGVDRSTLYRNHKRYQKQLELLDEAGEKLFDEFDFDNLNE